MNALHKILALLAILLVGLAALTLAEVAQLGYVSTRGTASVAVKLLGDGVAAPSSASWTSPVAPYYTRGNTKIGVCVEGTDAEGSQEISVGLYHYDSANGTYTFLGLSDVKAVALSADMEVSAGLYTHEDYVQFETNGANCFDLRVTALTCDLDVRAWGVGSDPTLRAAPAAE